jgi:glycine cleavage system aminomethyltransferase T
MSALDAAVLAARERVALSSTDDLAMFRLNGDGAFELLDRLCTSDIKLRDGQLLHTLMLREDGTPLADVLLGLDDERWIVLAEGESEPALFELLSTQPESNGVEIERLSQEWGARYVHGPFAWELLAAVFGPEVIGFPFLSFFRPDRRRVCFRAGKTGEFGYLVAAPLDELDALDAALDEAGAALDMARVGPDVVAHCAVENATFDILRYRALGHRALGLTPIELQLQARLSPSKDFVGRARLDALRSEGVRRRTVGVISVAPLAAGAEVYLDAARIGLVLDAVRSPMLRAHVGSALLDMPYAHSGIARFRLGPSSDAPALRTASPPFIANRSLFINPQRHSYATRDEIRFAPIAGFIA